jgi:tetratricopeptide (TPR) repeat protein
MWQGMRTSLRRLTATTLLILGLVGAVRPALAVPVLRDFSHQPQSAPQSNLPAADSSYGDVVKAMEKGDFSTAVRLASGHVASAPRDAQAHLMFVLANVGAGNYSTVRRHMEGLTSTAPHLAVGLRTTLANYYMSQRRFHRASIEVAAIPAAVVSPEVQLLRANLSATQGNVKGAIGILAPLAYDTKSPLYESVLVNLARLSLVQGDAASASKYAQRLDELAPGNVAALVLVASASLQTQDYKRARDACERILAKEPKNEFARFMLGISQFLGGDFNAASATFSAVGNADGQTGSLLAALSGGANPPPLRTEPADGLMALAIAAQRAARAERIDRTVWAAAATVFPDFERPSFDVGKYPELTGAVALRTLATAAFLQRHVGGAPTQAFLRKASSGAGPFLDVIRARVATGDLHPEVARPILEKAAKAHPELVSIAIDLADLELQSHNGDRAVAIYRDAIVRFADMPQLRIRLGDVLNTLNRPKDAVTEYEIALKAFPQDNYLHNQLAATLTLVGDRSSGVRAVALMEEAIARASPKDKPFLQDTLAGALSVAGRKAEALATYRQLEKDGNAFAADSLSRYGRLLLEEKETVPGLRALERAVDAGGSYAGRAADVETIAKS